jgi:hypothetical protein
MTGDPFAVGDTAGPVDCAFGAGSDGSACTVYPVREETTTSTGREQRPYRCGGVIGERSDEPRRGAAVIRSDPDDQQGGNPPPDGAPKHRGLDDVGKPGERVAPSAGRPVVEHLLEGEDEIDEAGRQQSADQEASKRVVRLEPATGAEPVVRRELPPVSAPTASADTMSVRTVTAGPKPTSLNGRLPGTRDLQSTRTECC